MIQENENMSVPNILKSPNAGRALRGVIESIAACIRQVIPDLDNIDASRIELHPWEVYCDLAEDMHKDDFWVSRAA